MLSLGASLNHAPALPEPLKSIFTGVIIALVFLFFAFLLYLKYRTKKEQDFWDDMEEGINKKGKQK
jgi:hypothetical protein